jgi:hypothetical protein
LPSPTILVAASLLLAAAALAISLGLDLRRFLANTPVLTSISGVIAFKRAVTRQMYGALGVLLLGAAAVLVATAGLYFRLAEWSELPLLLAALAVFVAAAFWCRMAERRAKSIPAIDDEIAQHRDDVVRVWTTRPLPTWRDRAA